MVQPATLGGRLAARTPPSIRLPGQRNSRSDDLVDGSWRVGCVRLRRMASDGSALVLLHGGGASGGAWQDVIPLVSGHHAVYAPTAPGHRGGPPVQRRPATAIDLVDWAERYLDEQGLQRPHLAGHSMGGYLAIELARRGRAATVCAFAPGGFWASGDGLRAKDYVTSGKRHGNGSPGATYHSPRFEVVGGSSTLVPGWCLSRGSHQRRAGSSDP